MRAVLALADGTYFAGESFGAPGEASGEVVFNTSMMGYQEILTDPSYRGQIVTMTYPLIGNYGVNDEDFESPIPWVEGFIVKECSPVVSNWRARRSLPEFLQAYGIVGIAGIDTRALTRHLRDVGAQEGIISTLEADPTVLVARARTLPGLSGRDLVCDVTCATPYAWEQKGSSRHEPQRPQGVSPRVVAYDYGIKRNILRRLVDWGCRVTVVPASTPAAAVLDLQPDGIFLSNGPGDPAAVSYAVEQVKHCIKVKPVMGICLGHQILALACGAVTYKLKFGHHGGNQPIRDLQTERVLVTAENHGFAVDPRTLPAALEVTHMNLNDDTIEGMRHRELPVFSVQYHPEASPGPHDAGYLFGQFMASMRPGLWEGNGAQTPGY
ncbi:Carbamoyl-phosphate synthase small chain [Candidatus Entotheonellaceae bacterium PAL068K]